MVVTRTIQKIEELRERPHNERRVIALVSSGVGTLILLFLWSFFTVPSVAGSVRQLAGIGSQGSGVVQQTASVLGASPEEDQASNTIREDELLIVESAGEGRVNLVAPGERQ